MTPPYLPSYRPPYQQPAVPVRILKIVFFPYNPALLTLFLTFIFLFPHPKFNFSLTCSGKAEFILLLPFFISLPLYFLTSGSLGVGLGEKMKIAAVTASGVVSRGRP